MAQQLPRGGPAAKVLSPQPGSDEGYRVVLGPYPTRAQAEGIGRKLGRPFWIYQPTTPATPAPPPPPPIPTPWPAARPPAPLPPAPIPPPAPPMAAALRFPPTRAN